MNLIGFIHIKTHAQQQSPETYEVCIISYCIVFIYNNYAFALIKFVQQKLNNKYIIQREVLF
jgi:hypothetical protein